MAPDPVTAAAALAAARARQLEAARLSGRMSSADEDTAHQSVGSGEALLLAFGLSSSLPCCSSHEGPIALLP